MSEEFKERMVQDLMRKVFGVETKAGRTSPAYCALQDIRNGHVGPEVVARSSLSVLSSDDGADIGATLWLRDYRSAIDTNGYEYGTTTVQRGEMTLVKLVKKTS
ncbi:hypothetical protein [Agrobacterium genomosp. 2]|uniref:Uncharacterized protein n=1 Tax=Agrobacterium genomosp. 2 str. CFBP 5494 TaxID=1183436 RepID=A0A9W5AZ55_9HYPH|nr:hypothetical protein [Agrobacterium genomosp. 2]CUW87507.1 hypothetical protein AGR2A_Cc120076 [Agrobacterium genomosp. 2 str. CFBP 5494]